MPDAVLVRTPNWLGDCVMALPVFDRLREAFPNARIGAAVRPHLRACFAAHPAINDIVDAPKSGIGPLWQAGGALRGSGYDVGVLLPNSIGTALWLWRSGIPKRIGFARDWRRLFLTHPVTATPALHAAHQADYYLHLLSELGAPTARTLPVLHVPAEGMAEAAQALDTLGVHGPYTAVAPMSAYGAVKDWPPSQYAAACAQIALRTNQPVVVLGTPQQHEACESIAAADGVYNAAGATGLPGFFGLIAGATRFLGGDSGGAHVAAALGKPTVAIFGITEPSRTCALGAQVTNVGRGGEATPDLRNPDVQAAARAALASITVDEVLAAVFRA